MFHRPTLPVPPVLPGWEPLADPSRRLPAGAVLRWWWPTAVVTGFLILVAVVGGRDDPAPGLSTRSLTTLTLAAVALATLTIRRQAGPWALTRALAEYSVIVLLVGLLATPGAVGPAEQALAERPPAAAQEAASLPPGIAQVVEAGRRVAGAGRWLAEAWRRSDPEATQPTPPSTSRPQPTEGRP